MVEYFRNFRKYLKFIHKVAALNR